MNPLLLLGAAALVGAGIYYATRKPEPKKHAFPEGSQLHTPEEFGFALWRLGYPIAVGTPGWRYTDAHTRSEVAKFQRDYNDVRKFMPGEYGVQLGTADLRTDGIVDRNTVVGVENATSFIAVNEEEVGNWYSFVQHARGQDVPPVS